jgi:hypothetical protein
MTGAAGALDVAPPDVAPPDSCAVAAKVNASNDAPASASKRTFMIVPSSRAATGHPSARPSNVDGQLGSISI